MLSAIILNNKNLPISFQIIKLCITYFYNPPPKYKYFIKIKFTSDSFSKCSGIRSISFQQLNLAKLIFDNKVMLTLNFDNLLLPYELQWFSEIKYMYNQRNFSKLYCMSVQCFQYFKMRVETMLQLFALGNKKQGGSTAMHFVIFVSSHKPDSWYQTQQSIHTRTHKAMVTLDTTCS